MNIKKYLRVLQVARKPSKEEFMASSKICVLGIVIIGIIGFLIFLAGVLTGI
ncbi:MAG: protein translocase SEC61 complex subunit gamma [Candidatus Aenigmarchaeota archaeon]|nr:protein translocase SEC61 complex subunit gamma [Candidatus Aenigmarchaeota archaeon]